MKGYTDIHMHLVPGVDDGATDLAMSMKMLSLARDEGIQTIFATPHDGSGSCIAPSGEFIDVQYTKLVEKASTLFPDMRILRGSEVYYRENCMRDWIKQGKAPVMAGSKYLLFEFDLSSRVDRMEHALLSVMDNDWWPILAHAERYPQFHRSFSALESLVKQGVYLQINAYSLKDEKDCSIKRCARQLSTNELAHFIGSDAHRTNHRPPSMQSGVNYLYAKCRREYVDGLVYENAEKIIQDLRL